MQRFEFVAHRLVARNVRQRAADGLEETGCRATGLHMPAFRVGIDIDDPAVDFAIGSPPPDRSDGFGEGLVVENAAVDERGFHGIG